MLSGPYYLRMCNIQPGRILLQPPQDLGIGISPIFVVKLPSCILEQVLRLIVVIPQPPGCVGCARNLVI